MAVTNWSTSCGPTWSLEEYINLEQRVQWPHGATRHLATGEENIIEQQSGNQMNDLEYRRNQLLKLQETVIDLEDLSSGVAITDLTLTDFRIDSAEFVKAHPGKLESLPLGCFAVTTSIDAEIPLASFFACGQRMRRRKSHRSRCPLAPHYLVHVGEDGTVLLPLHASQAHLGSAQAPKPWS